MARSALQLTTTSHLITSDASIKVFSKSSRLRCHPDAGDHRHSSAQSRSHRKPDLLHFVDAHWSACNFSAPPQGHERIAPRRANLLPLRAMMRGCCAQPGGLPHTRCPCKRPHIQSVPGSPMRPAASIPARTTCSSLSEVSPDAPTDPNNIPSRLCTRTPPGTGTRAPPTM